MDVSKIDLMNKKRAAVGYLVQNKSKIPDGLEKFFDKLSRYENSLKDIVKAGQEAERTLNELNSRREQTFGSIASIVDIIADELPDDKCLEWSEKFEAPVHNSEHANSEQVQRQEPVDMAGSTSKQSAPQDPDM